MEKKRATRRRISNFWGKHGLGLSWRRLNMAWIQALFMSCPKLIVVELLGEDEHRLKMDATTMLLKLHLIIKYKKHIMHVQGFLRMCPLQLF